MFSISILQWVGIFCNLIPDNATHVKFFTGYIRAVNYLNERIGRAVSWLNTLLVLIICVDVVRRYVIGVSSVAVIETEWYTFSLVFLLGAGFALRHDKHVRVDVFYGQFSERKKAWVNLLGSLFFLIPFCVIIITGSLPYVRSSLVLREISPDPGGLPARYLIKAAIPVGFFLLLLQALALTFSSVLTLLHSPTSSESSLNG